MNRTTSFCMKKISTFFKGHLLILSMLFFVVSCYQPTKYSIRVEKSNREWMSKFFEDLFLEEGAIFTLWGSKPMTLIILDSYSEEDIQQWYATLSEEEKQNCRILESYDLPKQYQQWCKENKKYPMKNFRLVERKDRVDHRLSYLYFVNVDLTTSLLKKEYATFKQIVGFDFDPIEVIFDMEEDSLHFWNKVEQSSLLLGLLFGYGEANAKAFHLKYTENTSGHVEPHPSAKSLTGPEKISLKNFPIPAFMSFEKSDPVIAKYERERETIRDKYKGKDFLDFTLKRLME